MVLNKMGAKGSLVIETLLLLPLLASLAALVFAGGLFFLEAISLDQATSETVKEVLAWQIAGDTVPDGRMRQIASALDPEGLPEGVTARLIETLDASGMVRASRMDEASLSLEGGAVSCRCVYRSRFLPGARILSRAREGRWAP